MESTNHGEGPVAASKRRYIPLNDVLPPLETLVVAIEESVDPDGVCCLSIPNRVLGDWANNREKNTSFVAPEIIYRGIGNASRAQYFGWAVHIIHPTPCDSHLLGGRKKVGEEEKRRLSSHQNTICQRNRIRSGMTHLCYHF